MTEDHTRLDDLQGQVDRRIETQERERSETKDYFQKQIDLLYRELMATLEERLRAVEISEREREKAAAALREGLTRQIQEGDDNLDRHVAAQFKSIEAALIAQEKLAQEKDLRIIDAQKQAQRAVDKAEEGLQRRLDLLNEFRAQLADEAAKYASREIVESQVSAIEREQRDQNDRINKLELLLREGYLQKEVFETALDEWTRWRDGVNKWQTLALGRETEQTASQEKLQPWTLWAAGAAVTIFLTLIVVLVNVLAGG